MDRMAAGMRVLVLLRGTSAAWLLSNKGLTTTTIGNITDLRIRLFGLRAGGMFRCVCTYAFVYCYTCVCVGPPQKAPLCAVLEAAFLIRGHYMRLVQGSPGRGEGIRAQIRPSRPLAVPGHHGNET